MTYYKFLQKDGIPAHGEGRWSLPTKNEDGSWTPGDWWEIDGDLVACVNGLHGCTPEQLVYWFHEELYEMEYEGEVIEDTQYSPKVVGRKARLVRKIEAWTIDSAVDFAIYCAESVLGIFEEQRPGDFRPRKAIKSAKAVYAARAHAADAAHAAYDAAAHAAHAARAAADAARAHAADAAHAAYVTIRKKQTEYLLSLLRETT